MANVGNVVAISFGNKCVFEFIEGCWPLPRPPRCILDRFGTVSNKNEKDGNWLVLGWGTTGDSSRC